MHLNSEYPPHWWWHGQWTSSLQMPVLWSGAWGYERQFLQKVPKSAMQSRKENWPLEEMSSFVTLESDDAQVSDPKVHLVSLLILEENKLINNLTFHFGATELVWVTVYSNGQRTLNHVAAAGNPATESLSWILVYFARIRTSNRRNSRRKWGHAQKGTT